MLRKLGFSRWKRRQRVAHSASYGKFQEIILARDDGRQKLLSLSTIA